MLSHQEKIQLLRAIRKIGYFWACSKEEISKIISRFSKVIYKKGDRIIKEGEPGSTFFIIGSGKVGIIVRKNGNEEKIKTLYDGDYFGEIALLTGEPRNATVIAENDCELFVLHKKDFDELIKDDPVLRNHLFEAALERKKERQSYNKIFNQR